MSKIKAVVFDVDGVLVDSTDSNVALYEILLVKAGYKKPSREEIIACFHMPLWQSLEILTKSTDQREIKRVSDMVYDPDIHTSDLLKFPANLEKILLELHKYYKLAVVTSRIKLGMEHIFDVRDIEHLFDEVVVFEDYKNPKPHPEPLLLAAKRLNVKPSEAIYIGDSHTDIEAAKSAGMKSIHLAPEKNIDADVGITSFGGIVDAVKQLD
jgi:pyrophosphatase PpaX